MATARMAAARGVAARTAAAARGAWPGRGAAAPRTAAARMASGADPAPPAPGLTRDQRIRRERTLLLAIVLSAFGPFVTGYAVVVSESATQLADFLRRTIELGAMVISWAVFRYLVRDSAPGASSAARRRMLRGVAEGSVAAAMGASALIIAGLAFARIGTFTPAGNVYPGLAVALLGFGVNTAFQLRYAAMTRERYDSIIAAQRRLYLGKSAVDLCVAAALAAVAIAPGHPATAGIDLAGSFAVALYLAAYAVRSAVHAVANSRRFGYE